MMILHGGRLSPFVRRVELWLSVQQRPFDRNYASVFDADFGGLLAINPLGRVPVLVIDDGTSLFETAAIIDYLEETAPSGRRLIPASGEPRHHVLQSLALAHGIAEKTVALVYETSRRPAHLQWSDWQERIETQIRNGMMALESRIGTATAPEDAVGISATCAYDMAACKFPALTGMALPNLVGLSQRANALPAFAATHPSRA